MRWPRHRKNLRMWIAERFRRLGDLAFTCADRLDRGCFEFKSAFKKGPNITLYAEQLMKSLAFNLRSGECKLITKNFGFPRKDGRLDDCTVVVALGADGLMLLHEVWDLAKSKGNDTLGGTRPMHRPCPSCHADVHWVRENCRWCNEYLGKAK